MGDIFSRVLTCQRQAADLGFDWTDAHDLWAKLDEEIAELRAADTPAGKHEELGDLLFMVVNIARHLHVDPQAALDAARGKFERRFACVMASGELPPLGNPARLSAMEERWQQAKRLERGTAEPNGRD